MAMKRRLEGLTLRAVEVLAEVMETGTNSEKLTAAREVFDRAIGKPKQQATISVEHGPNSHLTALVGMALQTAGRVQLVPDKRDEAIDLTDYSSFDAQKERAEIADARAERATSDADADAESPLK
ncbi:hypothetical protein [Caudoviricetes sp.]|nr:hypothetical protein [Caudoviricetes sp.]